MAQKHVISRFALVTDEFIDACQKEFRSRIPLVLEDEDEALFPAATRALIARESIDADRLAKAGPEILIERELSTFGDWMLLCLSEFLTVILEDAKEDGGSIDPEILVAADRRAVEALFMVANSPIASPLVNYEALNGFLAATLIDKGEPEGITHLLRALAAQLDLNDADGSDFDALDLLDAWHQLGDFAAADNLFAALLRWQPDNAEYYELGSHFMREAGRLDAALAVSRRALELLTSAGDPDDIAESFRVAIEQMESEVEANPGEPASPALLDALTTDFSAGEELSPKAFCARHLPAMLEQPVKRPLTAADVDGYEELDVPETFRRETPKVGRNDPCPCGSGKKFKKCCGR